MTEIKGCSNVKLVVASPAAGLMYTQALMLQEMLGTELVDGEHRKVPVVPEAKPGGAGTIAAIALDQSDKNCTMLLAGNAALTARAGGLNQPKALDFDKMRPLGIASRVTAYMTLSKRLTDRLKAADPTLNFVNPTVADRAKIFEVLVRESQKNPLQFGTPGHGSMPHFAMLDMRDRTGARFEHIPFGSGSGANAAGAMKNGQLDVTFDVPLNMKTYVSDPGVFVLATTSSSERPLGKLGTIPPLSKVAGKDLEYIGWFGIVAPRDGRNAAALEAAIGKVVGSAEFRTRLAALDSEPGGPGGELASAVKANLERFKNAYPEVARELGR